MARVPGVGYLLLEPQVTSPKPPDDHLCGDTRAIGTASDHAASSLAAEEQWKVSACVCLEVIKG